MLVQSLWKILAISLALVLMLIIPMMHGFETEDRFVKLNLLDELDFFLDRISQAGEISKNSYLEFKNSIDSLGYPFDIEIKHYKKIYVPVYDNPVDTNSFKGNIKRVEELYTNSEIIDTLFPKEEKIGKSYIMNKGDFVVVTVKTDVKSKYQKLREMLFLIRTEHNFFARLGSVIKNEAY